MLSEPIPSFYPIPMYGAHLKHFTVIKLIGEPGTYMTLEDVSLQVKFVC